MKVLVDRERCEGHGLCEEAAPGVFRLDDDGELLLLIDPVPAELERSAQSAARVCPVAALHLQP